MSDIVQFGKYKGKPIEVLAEDQSYCEWLTKQDWFRDKYQNIYTLIINNFGEPSETPAHNRIQALFLDVEFCGKVLDVTYPRWRQEGVKLGEVIFEAEGGADVEIRTSWSWVKARVEIKPEMGDDFPAVMRQMRFNKCNVLYLGSYAGVGATYEQMVQMFEASGFKVILHQESQV